VNADVTELDTTLDTLEALESLKTPVPPIAVISLVNGAMPEGTHLIELSLTARSPGPARVGQVQNSAPGFSLRLDGTAPPGVPAAVIADELSDQGPFMIDRVDESTVEKTPGSPRRFVIDASYTPTRLVQAKARAP